MPVWLLDQMHTSSSVYISPLERGAGPVCLDVRGSTDRRLGTRQSAPGVCRYVLCRLVSVAIAGTEGVMRLGQREPAGFVVGRVEGRWS
jgi:hypothetical protein